jgi:glycosyltransferase involved in cell wall biosynthesis
MHLVDTLDPGGAERMAVNIVNALPRSRYQPYLCTTRRDGTLERAIAPDVERLRLERRHRFDVRGVRRLLDCVRRHDIELLHAHGATLFVALAATVRSPHPKLVWHDHYGRHETHPRSRRIYGAAVRRCAAVITVSQRLAEWSRDALAVDADRISLLPNFVVDFATGTTGIDLPGRRGMRVVCAANMRPQKDHPTLLHAIARVRQVFPDVHLLLAGLTPDQDQLQRVHDIVRDHGLAQNVTLLGSREDIADVLRASDIGVLSSASEGLPLALLEYGMAGLATVATNVGQVSEVLASGIAGRLVAPGNATALADELIDLLRSREERARLGAMLKEHVTRQYGVQRALAPLEQVYARAVGGRVPANSPDVRSDTSQALDASPPRVIF